MIPAEPRSWAVPLKPPADMPLGHFSAAHRRQRRVCMALTAAATAPAPSMRALYVLATDLAADLLCLEGAEDLLFDLLRHRAEPEDDISRVLGILALDHDADRALATDIAAMLRATSALPGGPAELAKLIDRFVARKLRNIALENAVVLPIARLRLTPADLCQLSAYLDQCPVPTASDQPTGTIFESE